ncbi:protein O-mannosyl-transferase Tmtc2 isoform X2 [Eurosta solidaginis]|uniref:protein O-mannosyl-transferase Tmtc2 isoform X2 n=1 Tax=Eurosta solidaginis TaxID=178769 RepID=UPI0035311F4F
MEFIPEFALHNSADRIKHQKPDGCAKRSMDYTSLGCCALAFVLYLNTLNAGFVYDDRRAILSNTDVSGNTPWHTVFQHDYWGTSLTDSGSHGSYRPLCVLSFRFNFLVGGYTPWGFHLINNLMHCLATGLVVKLARYFLSSYWGVLATGALFATHPIHTEAVAGIVGRADLAACIFYLLTYLMYMRHIVWRERGDIRQWYALILTVTLSLVALLFKETAITALLVCVLFDGIRGICGFQDKHRKRTLYILGASLSCIIYWRLQVLPRPQTAFSTADNPIAKMPSMWTRFLTFLYLPVFNFRLMLNPQILSFDWGMDAIPRINSLSDERNLLSFSFYGTLITLTLKSVKYLWKRRMERLVREQIYAQQQQYRLRKSRSKKKYRVPLTAVTLDSNSQYSLLDATTLSCAPYTEKNSTLSLQPQTLTHASQLRCACHDCKQELSFPQHTASCCALNNNNNLHWTNNNVFTDCCCHQLFQSSSTAPQMLALALRKALTVVVPRSSRSSSRCSNSTTASNNSSSSNTSSSNSSACSSTSTSKAENHYLKRHTTDTPQLLTPQSPRAAQQTNNACVILMAMSFLTLPFLPASNLFFYVGFVVAERLLYLPSVGYCLLAGYGVGKLMERVRSPADRKRKIALILGLSLLLSVLGVRTVQRNTDWYDEESLFRSAVQVNPPKALGNLGSVLSSQGRYAEAQEALKEAIKYRPNMADVHFNLGILHQNQQNYKAAIECFRKSIQFRPNLAGEFLTSQSRSEEALFYRIRAAELAPDDYALVVAAATALRLSDRKVEAESWYRKAVEMRPNDAHAHTNLGAILHLLGRTKHAANSYQEALRLQPGDLTTLGNLAKLGVMELK